MCFTSCLRYDSNIHCAGFESADSAVGLRRHIQLFYIQRTINRAGTET